MHALLLVRAQEERESSREGWDVTVCGWEGQGKGGGGVDRS